MGLPRLWDPAAGLPTTATIVRVGDMLFCAGHTLMADGRVMVSGGHLDDDRGLDVTNIFDPVSESWATGLPKMAKGRWYPTVTTLADGRVVTVAGRDASSTVVLIPEIWEGNRWVKLTGASLTLPYYPRQFVAPNGKLFYAGERIKSRYLDVDVVTANGRGRWSSSAGFTRSFAYIRDYGSAVMYEAGKILYAGGGGDLRGSIPDPKSPVPTATAETIDLTRHRADTGAAPARCTTRGGISMRPSCRTERCWSPAGPARADSTIFRARSTPPKCGTRGNGTWTELAANRVDRGYHSVSLLLPDGTVLHGAGGDANDPGNRRGISPADEPRNLPAALSVPGCPADRHQPLEDVAQLRRDLHRDHAVCRADHRRALDPAGLGHPRVRRQPAGEHPEVHPRAGSVRVTTPASGRLAPPGYYLLFLLNRNGVPSVGRIVRVG